MALGWRRMSFPMFSTQASNDSADRRLLPRQESFQTGHRIHMQMEAISNMQHMGGSTSNRISKVWTAVSRYDLHIGVVAKPSGHRFLFAVG
jgi:hypothetical protein